jgi:hypothetical protein
MRLLTTQRDSDRLYLEQQMELSANKMWGLEGMIEEKFQVLAEKLARLEKKTDDAEAKEIARLERLEALEKRMQGTNGMCYSFYSF